MLPIYSPLRRSALGRSLVRTDEDGNRLSTVNAAAGAKPDGQGSVPMIPATAGYNPQAVRLPQASPNLVNDDFLRLSSELERTFVDAVPAAPAADPGYSSLPSRVSASWQECVTDIYLQMAGNLHLADLYSADLLNLRTNQPARFDDLVDRYQTARSMEREKVAVSKMVEQLRSQVDDALSEIASEEEKAHQLRQTLDLWKACQGLVGSSAGHPRQSWSDGDYGEIAGTKMHSSGVELTPSPQRQHSLSRECMEPSSQRRVALAQLSHNEEMKKSARMSVALYLSAVSGISHLKSGIVDQGHPLASLPVFLVDLVNTRIAIHNRHCAADSTLSESDFSKLARAATCTGECGLGDSMFAEALHMLETASAASNASVQGTA